MKNILLLIVLTSIISFPQSLKTKIDKLTEDKFFDTCLVSIQIEDLMTNNIIYKKNQEMLLRPASNMKIITTSAGLLYLTPDYEFKTNLYYDGYVSSDTLYGNLFVIGGCDPDFVTTDFYSFIDAIKSLNISVIDGNIYGDVSFKDSLYWGKGWMWDDDPSSDAPYLSALNLNDNCVEVDFDGSENKIIVSPRTNFVSVEKIESPDHLTIDRDWLNRKNEIIIKGKNDFKKYHTKVNVLEPAKYFLTVFKEVLDSNSIDCTGKIDLKTKPYFSNYITSVKRKFSDVIVNLNKTSDNLSAEMTLYALADKYSGSPATADSGIQFINMMIDSLNLDHKNYRIVDGSGVSHYNVVSSELLVNILKFMYKKHPGLYSILYNSFPIAGVDGTLENRMRNTDAQYNVYAKTGSLTGVSSLSGYVKNKKNHLLAFSIIMQNYVGSSRTARNFQNEICKILAESY